MKRTRQELYELPSTTALEVRKEGVIRARVTVIDPFYVDMGLSVKCAAANLAATAMLVW